jgi:hypothetical protein
VTEEKEVEQVVEQATMQELVAAGLFEESGERRWHDESQSWLPCYRPTAALLARLRRH